MDTEEILLEGSSGECAKFLGVSIKGFYSAVQKSAEGTYSKALVEVSPQLTERDYDAIRKWDEFTEPLREKYGVPVYRRR